MNTDACGRGTFSLSDTGTDRQYSSAHCPYRHRDAVGGDMAGSCMTVTDRVIRGREEEEKASGKIHGQARLTGSARTNLGDCFSRIVGKDALQKVFP